MADGHRFNVLIVGSSEAVCGFARDLPAGDGFRLTGTEDPDEATAAARLALVDVALVDLASFAPDDDVRVAQRLRSEAPDLPLVLVSGGPSPHTTIEAMRLGVIDLLCKPLSRHELPEAVGRAVRWRREADETGGADDQHEQQMADLSAKLVQSFSEAGIACSADLDTSLAWRYRDDPWTLAHVRRVADLSVSLAMMVEADELSLGWIQRAALLHDVGKLAIPPAILQKPGPLTVTERDLVRSHVGVAFEVAFACTFLQPSAEIVLASRERFDGSGYPRRLRGSAIPVGARIIAVAEAFDTVASARAAAGPASADIANAELVRSAGSLFDPDVIRAWLRCVDGGIYRAGIPGSGDTT